MWCSINRRNNDTKHISLFSKHLNLYQLFCLATIQEIYCWAFYVHWSLLVTVTINPWGILPYTQMKGREISFRWRWDSCGEAHFAIAISAQLVCRASVTRVFLGSSTKSQSFPLYQQGDCVHVMNFMTKIGLCGMLAFSLYRYFDS